MIPGTLVLATANPGKIAELGALARAWGVLEVLPAAGFSGVEFPPETGSSYAENATRKAREVALATALPALADDSGLEVDALGGAPGVRSARLAGDDASRIARLLALLDGVPPAARTARFRCAVALAWPDGRVLEAEGSCEGRVADGTVGNGGFGYDPVFVVAEIGRTFAQMAPAEKARVSHRGRAMRALGALLAP